jgi:hypothetical protein
MLSKDAILAAADTRTEEVHVPEWAGPDGDDVVLVRGMTGRERDEFEASLYEERGGQRVFNSANIRAKAIVKCVVDAGGARVFTDSDANALGEKSGAPIDRLYDVVARLSGLRDEDIKAKARDFPETTGNGSSTPSPNGSASLSPAF